MKNKRIFKFWFIAILPLLSLACGYFTVTLPQPAIEQANELIKKTPSQIQATYVSVFDKATPLLTSIEEEQLVELYKRINPSVVNIVTYINRGALVSAGQGSGFVFDSSGHIVTNSHVVHGADAIDIVFSDDTIKEATLVGEDMHSDLAVLKVEDLPENVQPIPLGDINSVAVGQTVLAIGNPFGLGGTLTRGIVSALGRSIPALTAFSIPQAIQTDAPINPGNSGGPLLNLRGQVIGVNAQIETGDGSRTNSGVGFAIPVSIVSKVIPTLISTGSFHWPWLGVVGGSLSPSLVQAMNLDREKGAYISQVVRDGPADKAGLRGSTRQDLVNGHTVEIGGDLVIAIDGVSVSAFEDVLIYIALNSGPGQTVTLTILRNNQQKDIQVELAQRPENTQEYYTFP